MEHGLSTTSHHPQFALAIVVAFLYYAPALAVNRLLAFLEQRFDGGPSGPRPLLVGYAYVLALMVALLADAIVEGQLWSISNASLCSRLKMQLNTLIYAKTLRRKDVTGSGGSATASEEASIADSPGSAPATTHASASSAHLASKGLPGAPPAADPSASVNESKQRRLAVSEDADDDDAIPTFSSRGQILNLFSVDVDRVSEAPNYTFTLEVRSLRHRRPALTSPQDCPIEIAIGTVFLCALSVLHRAAL
jgi:hypothetical protein